MLRLKAYLAKHHISQAELARSIGISRAAMTNLLNKGEYPKREREVVPKIERALQAKGIPTFPGLFEAVAPDRLQADEGIPNITTNEEATLEITMLLRKQTLTQQARKHFSLFQDPFNDDIMQSSDDVFATPDIRYVREYLWSTAKFGGFVAVVGESGAGKSTLRRDLIERIKQENEQVIVIEPYILGMEDNDRKGKTLKASSIAEAIITTIAPLERIKTTPEARYAQLHRLLRDSCRAGNKHLLIIEEAHGLPLPTLKHLKRFRELEDGFKKLLSIALIGQPELRLKLSETNPEVREVTQRIEIAELQPLDVELENYLNFKFARVGKRACDVIDVEGIEAMRSRLTVNAGKRGKVSLLHPLVVNNFLTAAMNLAASIGIPTIDADTVKEV